MWWLILKVHLTGLIDAQEMSSFVDVTLRSSLKTQRQVQTLGIAIPFTSSKFTCKVVESGY